MPTPHKKRAQLWFVGCVTCVRLPVLAMARRAYSSQSSAHPVRAEPTAHGRAHQDPWSRVPTLRTGLTKAGRQSSGCLQLFHRVEDLALGLLLGRRSLGRGDGCCSVCWRQFTPIVRSIFDFCSSPDRVASAQLKGPQSSTQRGPPHRHPTVPHGDSPPGGVRPGCRCWGPHLVCCGPHESTTVARRC